MPDSLCGGRLSSLLRALYPGLKRAQDLCGAVLGLLVLSPVLAAVWAAIRVTMQEPALFKQERVGLLGRPFVLLKFRTMRTATASDGQLLPDTDRITPLGRLLRRTSLDETPQLWNVVRGDMSLVGPRPLLPQYLGRYTERHRRRHQVKPGITGWAQINGRNSLSWTDRFELDVWYVDHRSTWLDTKVVWLTLLKVIRRDGISRDGHATMPEFTGY